MRQISTYEQIELSETLEALAEELQALQAEENGGRGISCVQTVLLYLRRGDPENAAAVLFNEWGKIRNYPRIVEKIRESEGIFLDLELDLPTLHGDHLDELYGWKRE